MKAYLFIYWDRTKDKTDLNVLNIPYDPEEPPILTQELITAAHETVKRKPTNKTRYFIRIDKDD